MTKSRAMRFLAGALLYAGIIAVTLVVVDGICIALTFSRQRTTMAIPTGGAASATGAMALWR